MQAQAYAQSSLDTELGTQEADKASVESAEASLESAKLNVEFTKVRSLVDGIAGQAAIQVGNLVSTSSQLVEVSQVNPIKVYFFISEQEYMSLTASARSKDICDRVRAFHWYAPSTIAHESTCVGSGATKERSL